MGFDLNQIFNSALGYNGGDKGGQGIVTYSVGFTNPVLNFNSLGLSAENNKAISPKLKVSNNANFDLDPIKTKLYRDNRSIRSTLMAQNITNYPYFVDQTSVYPSEYGESSNTNVENVFTPSVNVLMNMNNYRFEYNQPITNIISYYKKGSETKSYKADGINIKVAPSLFNPLFMVQVIGMTANVPLLNTPTQSAVANQYGYEDVSNCTIKDLVTESYKPNSILGQARYRYSDFMYCKDLGKVSNNHLITLRRFSRPIGDNIFELSNPKYEIDDYSFSAPGDIGRLISWFGTDDNKLEDILNFEYKATWKPLNSKIDEVESKEEDAAARGPMGMFINSSTPSYNEGINTGTAGGHHLFSKLGAAFTGSSSSWVGNISSTPRSDDAKNMQRLYDHNKVYEPKNTIQDTHTYEGKLQFTHSFKLTFSYKLRAYDNINPKSAFLDLLGNILVVTYRRGAFWGGSRRMIGPPQNKSSWQKANAFVDGSWNKLGGVMAGLMNGTFNLSSILGSISGFASQFMDMTKSALQNPKETLSRIGQKVTDVIKATKLDKAALGTLKNSLGRPALYALDSLLEGGDVGLWHVTIGNPKNPIVSMGNLILESSTVQQMGPLGLDDFPTELKITCQLKHARSRDAVEIGRMYTKGTNGLYFPLQNKNINQWFATNMASGTVNGETKTTEDLFSVNIANEQNEATSNMMSDAKDNLRKQELSAWQSDDNKQNVDQSILINNKYKAMMDQHNQYTAYDLLMNLDEIA